MWCGINGHTTVVRMCPPLTTKNWLYYVPQVVVGTTGGVLYVVSLRAEAVVQEIAVHTCPIRSAARSVGFSLSVSLCHSVSLSVSVYLSLSLSVSLSLCLSLCLSLSLSLSHTHTHSLSLSLSLSVSLFHTQTMLSLSLTHTHTLAHFQRS